MHKWYNILSKKLVFEIPFSEYLPRTKKAKTTAIFAVTWTGYTPRSLVLLKVEASSNATEYFLIMLSMVFSVYPLKIYIKIFF